MVHLTIIMAAERSIIDLFIDYKKQKKPKPSIKTSKIDALLVYFAVKSEKGFFGEKFQNRKRQTPRLANNWLKLPRCLLVFFSSAHSLGKISLFLRLLQFCMCDKQFSEIFKHYFHGKGRKNSHTVSLERSLAPHRKTFYGFLRLKRLIFPFFRVKLKSTSTINFVLRLMPWKVMKIPEAREVWLEKVQQNWNFNWNFTKYLEYKNSKSWPKIIYEFTNLL